MFNFFKNLISKNMHQENNQEKTVYSIAEIARMANQLIIISMALKIQVG